MKTLKISSILLLGVLAGLTACSKNSILQADPDTFSKAVDKYCDGPKGWDYKPYMHICASYYYDTKDALTSWVPADEVKKDIASHCPEQFKELAEYLNKDPKFQGVTSDMLASHEVWEQYFKGKHEMSNYFSK